MRTGERLLGVVLAGGESRRFGETKALAPVGGRPLACWALDALEAGTARQAVVVGDARISRTLGVPGRADRVPGKGPAGGLLTALGWAEEEGLEGVFLLACDLPLVTGELIRRILAEWPSGAPAAVPESQGPLGMEPLCAGYSLACLSRVEELLKKQEIPAMETLVTSLGAVVIPTDSLGSPSALRQLFLNVNTRTDARRVETLLAQATTDSKGESRS